MILVAGTLTYDSSKRAEAEAVVAKAREATRAEPGNLAYEFSVDFGDASLVHVHELWESEAALDEHMTTPHLAELMTALAGLGVDNVDVSQFEVGSQRPLTL